MIRYLALNSLKWFCCSKQPESLCFLLAYLFKGSFHWSSFTDILNVKAQFIIIERWFFSKQVYISITLLHNLSRKCHK